MLHHTFHHPPVKSLFRMIFLRNKQYPIYDMLRLEESIMRCDSNKENIYILTNEGTPEKSIIMGSSGNVEKLVFTENTIKDKIPIVKRFSGGGTVLVDEQTVFVSIIGSHQFLKYSSFDPNLTRKIMEREQDHEIQYKAYPEEIMSWTHGFYNPIFPSSLDFKLRENDYIFYGGKKFGGNAQYVTGGKSQRWVHHTSFLWDMNNELMERYLKMPEKKPEYRHSRSHTDFLVTLKNSLCKEDESIRNQSDFVNLIRKRVHDLSHNDWKDHVKEFVELHSFDDFQHFIKENTLVRTTFV
ncbi:hypothetical protein C9374_002679 [Naegleria lovaniensis]|uniref:BPL/LPL catalytic domain-containing protein n=1 Tax=Naegleria lovaniensis TaxID=51637 RepID=A0AA88GUH4_NAELO|nr:uncharacterized protein C9374_002679 [Naegleria lovaniensis]KAG2386233.1 hypothetical protein C9374_002679 [Naegleria lovaniensis]